MATIKTGRREELAPYVRFTFGFKRGIEEEERADYCLSDDGGLTEAQVARWLNRALASSGLDTLKVMVKP